MNGCTVLFAGPLTLTLLGLLIKQCWAEAPMIVSQPQGQFALQGTPVELRVAAQASEPVAYYWWRSGTFQLMGTNAVLTFPSIRLIDGGTYWVVVSNSLGTATSLTASITVLGLITPPEATAAVGARFTFEVQRYGPDPVLVQWFKDGIELETSVLTGTSARLVIYGIQSSDAGTYSLAAISTRGSLTPAAAQLMVVPSGPLDHLHPIAALPRTGFLNIERYNGAYIAVGDYTISVSSNLSNWTTITNLSTLLWDTAYGNGVYVAAGENATYVSADLVNWDRHALPPYDFARFLALTYGDGKFVAASQQDIYASTNGLDWTLQTPAFVDLFCDVVYAEGLFVMITFNGNIQTSPDGETWTTRVFQPLGDLYLYSVAYGNGVFVATGSDGRVLRSENGLDWKLYRASTPEWFSRVRFVHSFFYGVTRSSSLLSSRDGRQWTLHARGNFPLVEPFNYFPLTCPSDNGFIIVGADGKTILETDPILVLGLRLGATPQIEIDGPVGRACKIEYSDSIFPGVPWKTLGTFLIDSNPLAVTDPDPSQSQRYYRASTFP